MVKRILGTTAPQDTMTTSEVMFYMGYDSPRSASSWLRRMGVDAHARQPGSTGENLYLRTEVEKAQASMVGRGARVDMTCRECGKGPIDRVRLYRQNNRGTLPPIWACAQHSDPDRITT